MTIKQINESIEEEESLKELTQAFSELAAEKIKKIRAEVLRNRLFASEILNVYQIVKQEAHNKRIYANKKSRQTLSLLLTSNDKFYGDIDRQLIKLYLFNISNYNSDKFVVGTVGQNYLEDVHVTFPYQKMTLQKDIPTVQELESIVKITQNYENVYVYYAQFKSVLVQVPTFKLITSADEQAPANQATTPQPQAAKNVKRQETLIPTDRKSFIFEPEIKQMLEFFENQINYLLIEEAFLESELARTGSRLISMEEAQVRAADALKDDKRALYQAIKSQNNKELLETIVSSLFITKI